MIGAELVASIDDSATGTWTITTESGTHYRLDLDARQLLRVPNGAGLRRDLEALELLEVVACAVGIPGVFHIQVREDDVTTVRITTPILAIESADSGD